MKHQLTNHRLKHDVCWAWASACVKPVAHLLRPEERKELHEIYYEQAQKALFYWETHAERERVRLSPSAN